MKKHNPLIRLLLLLTILTHVSLCLKTSTANPADSRKLTTGWEFVKGDLGGIWEALRVENSSKLPVWENVRLPHSAKITMTIITYLNKHLLSVLWN